jgi:hypothetical protein
MKNTKSTLILKSGKTKLVSTPEKERIAHLKQQVKDAKLRLQSAKRAVREAKDAIKQAKQAIKNTKKTIKPAAPPKVAELPADNAIEKSKPRKAASKQRPAVKSKAVESKRASTRKNAVTKSAVTAKTTKIHIKAKGAATPALPASDKVAVPKSASSQRKPKAPVVTLPTATPEQAVAPRDPESNSVE